MTAVALLKPRSNARAMVGSEDTTTHIGSGGDTFYMRCRRAGPRFWSPRKELTGDLDTGPRSENNMLVQGRFPLDGYMVAGQGIGIASLNADHGENTNNTNAFGLQLIQGEDGGGTPTYQSLSCDVVMERIQLWWHRGGDVIPVRFNLVKTGALTEARTTSEGDAITANALAHAMSHSAAVLEGGILATATASTFNMHIQRAHLNFWTKVKDVSGDGMADPEWVTNSMIHGRHVLIGSQPASQVANILRMVNSSTPFTRNITFTINTSSGRDISHVAEVASATVINDWAGQDIGLRMVIEKTGNTALTET